MEPLTLNQNDLNNYWTIFCLKIPNCYYFVVVWLKGKTPCGHNLFKTREKKEHKIENNLVPESSINPSLKKIKVCLERYWTEKREESNPRLYVDPASLLQDFYTCKRDPKKTKAFFGSLLPMYFKLLRKES